MFVGFYVNNSYLLIITLNENHVKVNHVFHEFFTLKFLFTWNKTTESNKEIESSKSE